MPVQGLTNACSSTVCEIGLILAEHFSSSDQAYSFSKKIIRKEN